MGESKMREEIIKMAREAGFEEALEDTLKGETLVWTAEPKHLERFFHMAQAAEREACAKVCDIVHSLEVLANPAEKCAAAIRARGQQ